MAMQPHQQAGILRPGDEEKVGFPYNPEAPEFRPLLAAPFSQFRQATPIPRDGFIPEETATLQMKNAGTDMTVDDLYDEGDLFRIPAYARIVDVKNNTELARIDGIVSNEGDVGDDVGDVHITSYDHSLFDQQLPKLKVRDVFTAATETTIARAGDPVVQVVFGRTRKVALTRVNFTEAARSGTWESPVETTL